MNGLELLPLGLLGFLLFYLFFPIWSYVRLSRMLQKEREENRRIQTSILNLLRSLQTKTEQKISSSEPRTDAESEEPMTASSELLTEERREAEKLRSSEQVAFPIFPEEESCRAEKVEARPEKQSVESSADGPGGTDLSAGEAGLSNGSVSAKTTDIKTSPASMRLPRPG